MNNLLSVLILLTLGFILPGCAGTTLVQRQHHLLLKDSLSVSVCFLRPSGDGFLGIMGVRGKPIEINLDGEDLISLSVGEYIYLDIHPGKYGMVIKSWTLEDSNVAVETTRAFILNLIEADSMYLLFTVEKFTVGDLISRKVDEGIDRSFVAAISSYNKMMHGIFPMTYDWEKPQPLGGYSVESVSRGTAREVATELTPVEGAQDSSLQK